MSKSDNLNLGGYKAILTDGVRRVRIAGSTKAVNPWDDESDPDAWTPNPAEAKTLRLVPSLYLAWWTRLNSAAVIPFTIFGKGDSVVDDSADYRNTVGFLASPRLFFGMAEAALTSYGRAYWSKRKNDYKVTKQLQYFLPTSIEPVIETTGLVGFKRTANSIITEYKPEDILYVWGYDEGVEIGPPTKWPLQSALACAGAMDSVNAFVNDFMRRGMVKATMLTVDSPQQPSPQEQERIENFWNKFMRGVVTKIRLFSSSIKPTIIGEGLEAFRGITITETLRLQIYEAMGTRHLLEDQNYATAKQRDKQFYEQQIIPDCRMIADALNQQVMEPMGYRLEIQPERLPCFAPDLTETAQVVSNLWTSFTTQLPADASYALAYAAIGRTPSEKEMEIIQDAMKAKQKTEPAPAPTTETEPAEEPDATEEAPDDAAMREDMAKFQRKALKKIGHDVAFDSNNIPADVLAKIHAALPACKSEAEVKGVFYEAHGWKKDAEESLAKRLATPPLAPDLSALIASIDAAVKALTAEGLEP